ncbi:MAG TPA: amylo-alpha-1,6-glucosidase [Thermoplasmata archaeon]|nr:amylo-alpha-1,6-glucosidase [Thermoplasmata archaeon]
MTGSPTAAGGVPVDPTRPVLVTGARAAAIGNGSGELSLPRETRGGSVEWGGVYAEGIRLTGPWWVRLVLPTGEATLASGALGTSDGSGLFESTHRWGELELRQVIAPVEETPGVAAIGRRLEIHSRADQPVSLRLEMGLSPFLAPVLVEGVKPYEYEVATRGPDIRITTHGFGLVVHSDPLPHHLCIDRASWIGGRRHGEVGEVLLDYDLGIPPGGSVAVSWILAGGLERSLGPSAAGAAAALAGAPEWGRRATAREEQWLSETPELVLPMYPEIEQGYRLARAALHRLYQSAEPDLHGLVAGYPWYCSIWGRDLAWMLPAVLWLGDGARVIDSLRTILRYQAKKDLAIVGAAAGEVPMQVTTGPIFLFGTSDTTLYYPEIVGRLIDHTGDPAPAAEFSPALDRIAAWAVGKSDPTTGLVRNGGEVAEIRSATDEAGSVHFGFDAIDTTIWDSTDRRDHAVDVQVLAVGMWASLSRLARLRRRDAEADAYAQRGRRLSESLPRLYAWPAENYFVDSMTLDGRPVARLRPNALRLISAGLVTGESARRAVGRVRQDDLTTAWGVRTLSARDPSFDPTAYHDGQVWPIATAWAADAALAAGETGTGIEYLTTIGRGLAAEHGLANECYRGDRNEPYDSCFLLGFSVAPFLTTLFERLWGIQPCLLEGTVRVEPRLPADGPACRLANLRLGPGRLDLVWESGRLTATWRGPGTLRVLRGDASLELRDGVEGVLEAGSAKPS